MSFQRVMDTARRLNLPMVITDVAGREPMVVMPLAVYERLLETASIEQKTPEMAISTQYAEGMPAFAPISEAAAPSPSVPQKTETPAFQAAFTKIVGTSNVENVLAMEERFYLGR